VITVTDFRAAAAAALLAAGAIATAAPAHADLFTMCPSTRDGVVGGHTSCAFADNVRLVFYASGMSPTFVAYSPVTGQAYQMTCFGRYPATFVTGETLISTRCFGGDDAEVVIW
jgi:hypothetical protein